MGLGIVQSMSLVGKWRGVLWRGHKHKQRQEHRKRELLREQLFGRHIDFYFRIKAVLDLWL